MNDNLTVWMMVGAPGCGKSTYAKTLFKENAKTVIICPDSIRAIIGTGEGDQSVSYAAFCIAKTKMKDVLNSGQNVIFDATNMYRKTRKDFIGIARACDRVGKVIAVVFECDKKTLLERNKKRGDEGGRNVPESVIDAMLARYQRPDKTEFDEVKFVNQK